MENMTIREFNEALASSAPVPGGGGVSAITAAMGVGLGVMVGSLTVGKKKYADREEELHALMTEALRLQTRFLALSDEDAREFQKLMEAYALPKEEAGREERIEAGLELAAAAPLETLRLCARSIELAEHFYKLGSTLMVSDAGCSVLFSKAAMHGAALNVYANTKLMKDREKAEKLNADVKNTLEKYSPLADRVYKEVTEKLTG